MIEYEMIKYELVSLDRWGDQGWAWVVRGVAHVPYGDPMGSESHMRRLAEERLAALQHQLTTLVVRAFFDSQFSGDATERAAAEAFLARVLPDERPEVAYLAAGAVASAL